MLGRFAEFFLFGLTPLIMAGMVMPAAFAAEEKKLLGEVFYRERIALPPDAVLTVRLVNGDTGGSDVKILAEYKVDPAGQVPIRFELKLDSSEVRLDRVYGLQAEISVAGVVWFASGRNEPVDPWHGTTKRLLLAMVKPPGSNG